MDYLSDIGVGAVLLNSIYQSPQKDLGYDVSDLNNVDPIFGTDDDFDKLVKALHDKGYLVYDFYNRHGFNPNFLYLGGQNF